MQKSMNRRPHEQYWIVGSVAFGGFMCSMMSSIVNISLPALARFFEVGTSAVVWVILSYMLTIVALLMPAGKLGDVLGLKRTFLLGYAFFTTGALFCGLAPTLAILITARCLQATGAALLVASSYAIIPKCLPADATGWAFGMMATAVALGVTCGAPLGCLIVGFLSWHWIFLIVVPVGILAILTAGRSLPPDARPEGTGGLAAFDLPGAILIAVSMLALMLSLNLGKEKGWTSLPILAGFITAALLLILLITWERRQTAPILDIALLKNRKYSAGIMASGLATMAYLGNNFMMPFYLELGKHLTTVSVGPMLMVLSIVMMFVGPNAGRLSDRVPVRYLTMTGMLIATLSFSLFAFNFGRPGLWVPVIYLGMLGLSFGMFFAPNNSQVMGLAPADKKGVASGFFATCNNLSQALGICIMETVFALSVPPGSSMKGLTQAAQSFPRGALAHGYRNALICGATLCASACLISAFIQINSGQTPPPEPAGDRAT